MTQFSLYPTWSHALIEGEKRTVSCLAAFIDSATAARMFTFLRHEATWKAERRRMVDRERRRAAPEASFSTQYDLPEPLSVALTRVTALFSAPFNSIALNLYRDNNDSVALHNGKLDALVPGQSIALLSLGATHSKAIREKTAPHRRLKVAMHGGSLLLMSFATQLHYGHGIPKERAVAGPRISLAFRLYGKRTAPRPVAHLRPTPSSVWTPLRALRAGK